MHAEFFQKIIARRSNIRWVPGATATLFPYRVTREKVNGMVVPKFTFKGLLTIIPSYSTQALIIEDCFIHKCKAWRAGDDLIVQLPPK